MAQGTKGTIITSRLYVRFRGLTDPHVAVHGSFSVMVNYHAIGLYCTSRSGFVLHDPQEEASLKVSVLVFAGQENGGVMPSTSSARGQSSDKSEKEPRVWICSEVERLSAVMSLLHMG